ncbi:MAG: GxxExxY protein [Akkermansiaceae bacterium]|jgi:GxxExxY protein|nr:GxxExxY protein [Akkermansiaceae bacterium]MDP4645501.1 GxxExxY protein [Akkermansiaceae bacterium]MDP4719844.1 GxxExxY protein [Akkermansiaceae bacterium]MDP4778692.1 GxxExxY protein [Akkermansiaceae bacterium]MDP4848284.1 GxxExxY protein [Akkermansiaceae bacterium]
MKSIDEIASMVVDCAFKVHQELGPGLLESAYEACLAHELTKRGLVVEKQKTQPVFYDGINIDVGYRMDLLVNDSIVIELKAVDQIIPIHQAQLMTYLKLSNKPLGFLINFNTTYFKSSIKRIANNYQES